MKKSLYILTIAFCCLACGTCTKPSSGSGKPDDSNLPVIPETPVTPRSYATDALTLPATARDHYQIYQVNLKLYGKSGAFGKVQARLDEIKALGTDILYLMPVYAEGKEVLPGMPGDKPFGSPYCIKNYKEVNSLYGTLDELRSLVKAAKEKGMKVMFDWVANHTSWDNVWLSEHPEWYEHKADGSIAWPTKDGVWKDVAQLDFSKKELWAAMEDALQYWVKELDIDGYRCDYAHGVRDDFWKEAIGQLKALKPGFLMLAESDFERMFDNGFDIIFDRAMKSRMISLFDGGGAGAFFNWYKTDQEKTPASKSKLFFVTNHDDATGNTPAGQFKSAEGGLAAFVLMAALNGSSMLYGSQEIAYDQTINFFNTMDMDWDEAKDFKAKYQKALQELSGLDRSGEMTASSSGRVVFVHYAPGKSGTGFLLGVNVSKNPVKADFPKGVAAYESIPAEKEFGPFEYQIWTLE